MHVGNLSTTSLLQSIPSLRKYMYVLWNVTNELFLIIMTGCIAHARNGHISTFGLKSDVTIEFVDPDSL